MTPSSPTFAPLTRNLHTVGSLICGVSPDVYVLIFGRALSGAGAAGIFIAILQVLGQAVSLEKRPKLFGAFGAVFGLASIIGPLIGVSHLFFVRPHLD